MTKEKTAKDGGGNVEEKQDKPKVRCENHSQLCDRGELVPTGSTLLNLALSDNPYGGWKLGSIVNLVGDTDAGKTFLDLNMYAELVKVKQFDDYRLIYDEPEQKLSIPIAKFYGQATEDRLEMDIGSDLIEDFHVTMMKILKEGEPFIYSLDSFDSLDDKEAREKKELKRDYDNKPRLANELFRKIKGKIRNTNSLLVIVSQVRDVIGVTFGPTKRRAGGKALGHTVIQEVWLAVKNQVKHKNKQVGVHVIAKVKKNHLTGKKRQVEFEILEDYGIDNVGSMIDWMVLEQFWEKKKGEKKIDTGDDFGIWAKKKLSKHIDENDLESKLITIVAECWKKVEDDLKTDRKPRYE